MEKKAGKFPSPGPPLPRFPCGAVGEQPGLPPALQHPGACREQLQGVLRSLLPALHLLGAGSPMAPLLQPLGLDLVTGRGDTRHLDHQHLPSLGRFPPWKRPL